MLDEYELLEFPPPPDETARLVVDQELGDDGTLQVAIISDDGEYEECIGVAIDREQCLHLIKHLRRLFEV